MNDVAALIVAAGQGTRFGGDLPKVFVDLAGSPLFLWSLRAYDACPQIARSLLAVSEDHLGRAQQICSAASLTKPCSVIPGGRRRQDTVLAGLEALRADPPDIIAIHDGARPLIDPDTIARSIALATEAGACVTAAPVSDTIKQAGEDGAVIQTPDRSALWRAQTPQTFRFAILFECYQRAFREGWEVTDDASVLERCGHSVRINPGPDTNIKITTMDDLRHAEALLRTGGTGSPACPEQRRRAASVPQSATPPSDPCRSALQSATPGPSAVLPSPEWRGAGGEAPFAFRIGIGYDVHGLVPGRKLILGGVDIPHETGLAGHSDADVLLHAICDAVLGAAAAGDIGALFPDTDPNFKGIGSAILCREVAAHIRELGYEIANVDATVIAQRPKLAPHMPQMRENIAAALGVEVSQVSVKATTTERLGFEGRQEGIGAQAVALLTYAGR